MTHEKVELGKLLFFDAGPTSVGHGWQKDVMRKMIVHGFAAVALGAALAIGLGTHAQAAAPANHSRACAEVVASNSVVEKAVYGVARRSARRTARRTSRRHGY